jgi:hypothetical protein
VKLPNSEHDIYISYSHLDNAPLVHGEKGWVDDLREQLEHKLAQILGYMPSIWYDARLHGENAFLDEGLNERLGKTCVLVCVLSPGYVRSEWCLRELREFRRMAEESWGLTVAHGRSRVFKVVKTYVERHLHPKELQEQTGYEFFEVEPGTGRPREYDQGLGTIRDPRYRDMLNYLARDIGVILEELGRGAEPSGPQGAR